jgi:putative PIN family toxin of toxin-antitoxin system
VRLVLDTNIIVAAATYRGFAWEVQEHVFLHHLVELSPPLLSEIESVLVRKFDIPQPRATAFIHELLTRVSVVEPASLEARVCRDPADDMVLGTALAGGCEVVISGDKDLTDLGGYESIRILTPRAFWLSEGLDRTR